MLRVLTAASLVGVLFQFSGFTPPARQVGRPSKPLTLQQVWLLNSTYRDQQHGITLRYPSVWKTGTQFGYVPPALTELEPNRPVAGFVYEEGGFPRQQTIGPYTRTNLEGVGIVYSVFPAANAVECQMKAASLAVTPVQSRNKGGVKIANRSYLVYETFSAGMSQSTSGNLYATHDMGTCYLFETGVAVASPDVADMQPLTEAQYRDIDAHLWDIMQTVRIVPKR